MTLGLVPPLKFGRAHFKEIESCALDRLPALTSSQSKDRLLKGQHRLSCLRIWQLFVHPLRAVLTKDLCREFKLFLAGDAGLKQFLRSFLASQGFFVKLL